ncbi:hypothetical protein, partial [Acinetobacter sp. YH16053]|uniref:hypothetical protein n=1 Tax=Acinetobacter sp. YH16053 TaxID=2601192 RepID=UPI0034D42165
VPAYGPQNDVTLKMPAFEWVHVQLHQQKGMISLSPPTICNSAVIPSNLPDRRDRKSPPQGEILIVSARWHGDRFFHHEPDFLGVKDQRFGTPIAQPLSERRLSGAERSVDPDYHCRRPLT